MAHLGGKGPLGQKQPKAAKAPKPMRKVSAKRATYMESPERQANMAHMARVALLPCMCCGCKPVEVHHVTGDKQLRSDARVIPLCWACHRGPQGYHNAKRAWVAKYGPDYMMLPKVAAMLQK